MKELGYWDVQIRSMFKYVGFGAFYLALNKAVDLIDRCVTFRIIEGLCDTTKTFHLPFKEMTITPL